MKVRQKFFRTPGSGIAESEPRVGCAGCAQRWGGIKTSHCSACHTTFSGITAFDKHRTGSHANDTRRCLTPEEAGLVRLSRRYECWGRESDGEEFWTPCP